MISRAGDIFYLETAHSSWLFHILPSGHAEHLHYGGRLFAGEAPVTEDMFRELAEGLKEKQHFTIGNGLSYAPEAGPLCLEALCTEFSSFGKGDIRDPFLELTYPDGSTTSDFLYLDAAIAEGKHQPGGLPGAVEDAADDGVQEL
ncbi:MAG: alpha-galactosidase, partial [Lachnospiraceae bacterium]|nr:alpha-galactosidase [Lachnospiraceae bacterium]